MRELQEARRRVELEQDDHEEEEEDEEEDGVLPLRSWLPSLANGADSCFLAYGGRGSSADHEKCHRIL